VRNKLSVQCSVFMRSSLEDSPMTLVSSRLTSRTSKRNIGSGAPNDRGIEKFAIFSQKDAVSQNRCKIGPKLLWLTNRKSHTRFRLVPKSLNLNDLERRFELDCRKDAYFAQIFTGFSRRTVVKPNLGGWNRRSSVFPLLYLCLSVGINSERLYRLA